MKSKLDKKTILLLIELFIKKESRILWASKDWARETIAVRRLIKEFEDFEFFHNCQDLYGKFNSILGLTGKTWLPILKERYSKFILEKANKKTYPLSTDKVIEVETSNKPKNILEFLNS